MGKHKSIQIILRTYSALRPATDVLMDPFSLFLFLQISLFSLLRVAKVFFPLLLRLRRFHCLVIPSQFSFDDVWRAAEGKYIQMGHFPSNNKGVCKIRL